MKTNPKVFWLIGAITLLSTIWTLSQNSSPLYNVNQPIGGFRIYNANGVPFVDIGNALSITGSFSMNTNVSAVITDRTNEASIDPTTKAVRVLVMNGEGTNVWWTGQSVPVYVIGTNNVGGFTSACTNTVTIATNAHTIGMAITSGELTNFFRVDGGSAWLQTITWTQFGQTNADNKIFWPFSRPITAVTNASLWGPTEADMMFLCGAPILLGCTTNELTPFGIVGFAQAATGLSRPMVNSWTNKELYYVVTQGPVGTAAYTSNAVTTARVRTTAGQD